MPCPISKYKNLTVKVDDTDEDYDFSQMDLSITKPLTTDSEPSGTSIHSFSDTLSEQLMILSLEGNQFAGQEVSLLEEQPASSQGDVHMSSASSSVSESVTNYSVPARPLKRKSTVDPSQRIFSKEHTKRKLITENTSA